ncbi:MAG TPA: TolC family protein [Telluria sp.]|nr:TolC family protein [Telluria sp.]
MAAAQRAAQAHSAQMHARAAAAAAAREMAVAAGQRPDPVLRAGVDNLPLSGPEKYSLGADNMTMRRIGVSQELTRAGKLALRSERYLHEAERSDAEGDVARSEVARATASAWFELGYAQAAARLVESAIEAAGRERVATEAAYRAGRAAHAEVISAREQIALLEDRRSAAAQRVRSAALELERWTGEAPPAALSAAPDTSVPPLDPATLERDAASHPEIAVLDRQIAIVETDARLAEAERRPDWSAEVAFQQRGPGYPNMISFGVSVPLQWDRPMRQDRMLAARRAMASHAQDERDESLRAYVADKRRMLEEWRTGRERIGRHASVLIPLAAERSAALLAAYGGGKGSLAELLAARRQELEVRLQALQLEADTDRLWAQLRFLTPAAIAASIKETP